MLGPSDEDIRHLVELGEDARRVWLLTYQPADPDDRFYWWETLVEVSLDRVRSSTLPTSMRRKYSLLAAQSTREAVKLQVTPSWKGSMRLAFLVSEYGRYPGSDVQEVLRPDQVAEDAFQAIGKSPEEVAKVADNWPSRPIDEIVELRRVKNIVHALSAMRSHVLDPKLRATISRWLDICEKLP
ncbi:hypothetical protein [Streptomyces sp. NPDC051704]|uniref:hypothetical protein n=1 Tax=Streptomyces sp. NPDC051704 TaxID=3365671 RepID=UPI00379A32A3